MPYLPSSSTISSGPIKPSELKDTKTNLESSALIRFARTLDSRRLDQHQPVLGAGFRIQRAEVRQLWIIPLSAEIGDVLRRIIAARQPNEIVFYGRNRKDLPLSRSVIEKYFREALPKIGVSNEKRANRVLRFHSYRHSVIRALRASGVPDAKEAFTTAGRVYWMILEPDRAQRYSAV